MNNKRFYGITFAIWLGLVSFTSAAGDKLSVVSWNLEWLTLQPVSHIETSQRNPADFAALADHFAAMDVDVLAFQEVDDELAIKKVVGQGYNIWFSDRAKPASRYRQFDDINQYTGFAIRSTIPVADKPDFPLDDSSNSKLRFASYVVLYPNSPRPIHLLSVHLKAGCSGAYKNSRHCRTLKGQAQRVNQWLSEREANREAYILLGDFNHNLAYNGDWLWRDLTQGTQASLVSQSTPALCKVRSRNNRGKTHQFRSLIDHIIVGGVNVERRDVRQIAYPVQKVLDFQLSDHCPIQAQVGLK
ncbi:endonuclease/exonuclease/phosphatase family protein [Vibrio sp.]|uniref:endonuclease/exonuclease/phosphatase family protein n=1 Tax=Vibrio sp. TaxID=678 RepID=UPI003D12D2DC